jgi:hypothetical protein
MRAISDTERKSIRSEQVRRFLDECQLIGYPSSDEDPYGMPVREKHPLGIMPCRVRQTKGQEAPGSQTPIMLTDILLPADTAIDQVDSILVTKQYGEPLDPPIEYRIVGTPTTALTCVVVPVARKTLDQEE